MHISQGLYWAEVCESLRKGFLLELELPLALPEEPDSSGKRSRSHPEAGLPWPQPLPPPPQQGLAALHLMSLQVGLAPLESQLGREYTWQVIDEGYIISAK